MTLNEHILYGTSTDFLINYLKALGVFKLLSVQKDNSLKGFWQDGYFHLVTGLSKDEILQFFLNEYEPSPMVAPWNGGSGFYGKKAANQFLRSIEQSTVSRLEKYRTTIKQCWDILEELEITEKPNDKTKSALRIKIRQTINDDALEIMDTLYLVFSSTDKPGETNTRFGFLFGSGGNDGNLEFTNSFMQYLSLVIPFGQEEVDNKTKKELELSEKRLRAALFKDTLAPGLKQSVGQFFPGGAGGVNQAIGYSAGSLINPWDYILALEGILFFKGSVVRKLETDLPPSAAFPFTVRETAAGSGSVSTNDEGSNSRGEVWLPVWSKPATYRAVNYLFYEGRVVLGRRKASNGLDFARAVANLGVDRGIDSFERIGLVSGGRFGNMNFAVSLGTFPVSYHKEVRLLDEIDNWLNNWRRFAGSKGTPARYRTILRNLEDAIFRYTQFGQTEDFTAILIALGLAEESLHYMVDKDPPCQPLTLSPRWVEAADDGSVEFRLAAALASIEQVRNEQGKILIGAMREFVEPVQQSSKDPSRYTWVNADKKIQGSSFDERLLYILERRLIQAEQNNLKFWPIQGRYKANLNDINMFLNNAVDMEKIEKLYKGLILINWPRYSSTQEKLLPSEYIDPAFATLKLLFWPEPLKINNLDYKIVKEFSIVTYLRSGDLYRAMEKALIRLRASNLNTKLKHTDLRFYPSSLQRSVRLGASLLIPLHARELPVLLKSTLKENVEGVS